MIPSPPLDTAEQHRQEQLGSIAAKSAAKEELRKLRFPREVIAFPKRCETVKTGPIVQATTVLGIATVKLDTHAGDYVLRFE